MWENGGLEASQWLQIYFLGNFFPLDLLRNPWEMEQQVLPHPIHPLCTDTAEPGLGGFWQGWAWPPSPRATL